MWLQLHIHMIDECSFLQRLRYLVGRRFSSSPSHGCWWPPLYFRLTSSAPVSAQPWALAMTILVAQTESHLPLESPDWCGWCSAFTENRQNNLPRSADDAPLATDQPSWKWAFTVVSCSVPTTNPLVGRRGRQPGPSPCWPGVCPGPPAELEFLLTEQGRE